MKIAIFRTDNSFLKVGQYNCQEIGLGKALLDSGHQVFLVLLKPTQNGKFYPDCIKHENKEIKIIQVEHSQIPILDYPLLKGIRHVFEMIKPDLCHINEESCPATIQVAYHANANKIPIVIYHGMYLTPNSRIRQLYEKVHHYCFRPWLRKNVKYLFAKTSRAHRYLLDRDYSNSSVLPVGLDISCFESRTLSDDFSEPNLVGRLNVIYVGVFEKRRNINFLLEIAKCYPDRDVNFIFVGEGPEFEATKLVVKENGLENVILTGVLDQSQLSYFYKNASLFFLASDYEIFGMVYLEAMFFGLPVVTNLNAGSEDLISSENGRLMNSLDSKLWIEAIIEQLNSIDDEMKNKIKNKFKKSYTWDRISIKYISVIESKVSNT